MVALGSKAVYRERIADGLEQVLRSAKIKRLLSPKADVHANAIFLVFSDDCSASRPDIGFFQLAPIIFRALSITRHSSLAITCAEENDEISNNQTTDKTRASVDTSENQESCEGTRRTEGCRPTFENQA
jgi:hypothetical protein